MARVYPPKWCRFDQFKDCNRCDDFEKCDNKIIRLFKPLQDTGNSSSRNATTIAVYYGYCQRLAKYFLSFPDIWPIGIVQRNFLDTTTGKGAKAEIQRILLDLIDHGDPNAPTNLVHELRLKLILQGKNEKKGCIVSEKGEIELNISETDDRLLDLMVQNWTMGHLNNALTFQKTGNLSHCQYCFVKDCEQF
jgi:hypothetical protein